MSYYVLVDGKGIVSKHDFYLLEMFTIRLKLTHFAPILSADDIVQFVHKIF